MTATRERNHCGVALASTIFSCAPSLIIHDTEVPRFCHHVFQHPPDDLHSVEKRHASTLNNVLLVRRCIFEDDVQDVCRFVS